MLLMRFISGMTMPDTNCALQEASVSPVLISSNWRMDSSSRPKALTTLNPEYISSTWPLSSPRFFCWAAKLPCDLFVICEMPRKATGRVRRLMRVKRGLMVSIMMITPTIVQAEVMSWVRLCWSVLPILSMSFVTRLMTSPWLRES